MTLVRSAVLAGAFAWLVAAPGASELGQIDFPTSAKGEAQERFVHGVLLLHSFMYDDAAEEFQAAQKADPGFALAYWGEAMTFNHPLWMDRDAEGARKTLAKLAPTREARLAKTADKREWGYLNAVEELYAEGEKKDRDAAYADAMRKLHDEFPSDLEAQSFYALALMGSCEDHREFPVYMRAAALAEEVFAKNPRHPGAVHYLIHAYDDPVHAPLGLRPARVYAKIAGSAAHALHMPSHIFFALGMWDDVIASNEDSWRASDERVKAKHKDVSERGWHGIYWREYALLQQGRNKEAKALVAIAEEDAKSGLRRVINARDEMRATWAIETNCAGWTPGSEAPTSDRDWFVSGFCAAKKGDPKGLAAALDGMAKRAPGSGPAAVAHEGMKHGYGGGKTSASVADVLRLELEALSKSAAGDDAGAVSKAREAAALEDAMSFEFGPPAIVKPTHELMGELFMMQKKPKEALMEFQASLASAPGRARSLWGSMRAARGAGDRKTEMEAGEIFARNRKKADAGELSLRAPFGYTPLDAGSDR
jgi:tetratricopeptide (TPR) repeat protein